MPEQKKHDEEDEEEELGHGADPALKRTGRCSNNFASLVAFLRYETCCLVFSLLLYFLFVISFPCWKLTFLMAFILDYLVG